MPEEDHFTVDEKISQHPLKVGMMRVADTKGGKKSKTDFEVLERILALVITSSGVFRSPGARHQIRIHLKHAGFPIVADELYGGKQFWLSRIKRDYRLKPGREERPLMGRVALHAEELTVEHPVTKEAIVIKSEWPKDLRVTLKYLKQYASGPAPGGADFSDSGE